jgi:tyrosyl-tRNA synthetase
MTFLEFNYMILQGYDFRHLAQAMGVRLQMGGSDQWGNIVNGIELTRRMESTEVFGLTTPLLTTADGAKMGKTAAGAVWLNEDALPAYDFWQFWRNTDDRDVGRFLRLFTDLELAEIAELDAREGAAINSAKEVLATEVTRLVRGEAAAQAAAATAASTFAGGGLGRDLPVLAVPPEGISAAAACTAIGFTASNREAKQKIAEGAVRLGDSVVQDPGQLVRIVPGDEIRLSVGKKKHGVLRPA